MEPPNAITYRHADSVHAPSHTDVGRLRSLTRRGKCEPFVALQGGTWGVAADSLDLLDKRLRGDDDADAIYRVRLLRRGGPIRCERVR